MLDSSLPILELGTNGLHGLTIADWSGLILDEGGILRVEYWRQRSACEIA